MAFDLHRRGHELGQLAQVRRTSDAVELLAARQLDLHGERVDALAALEQRLHRPVDPLVPSQIEIVSSQKVGDLEDGVAIDEETAEHLLLGRLVVWKRPVRVLQRHSASRCRVAAILEHTFGVDRRGIR